MVATVLLIVVAVGLGVLVMNFGRAQIEDAARCSVNINLKFVELNGEEQICIDKENNQIYFILENGGSIELSGARLRVIGADAILVTDFSDMIEKYGTLMKYIPYDYAKYGEARQFKLTPRIDLYGQEEFCDEQSLIVENVRECVK